MPVLRKRERIREDYSGSPVVQTSQSGGAQIAGAAARVAGERAYEYSKLMAHHAQREAEALAKAATFSTGPGGLPQMPADPTAKMGRIARETYDDAIQERFAHQMTTAMRAQIADAENANMYDFDAFRADAEGRLAAMAADVPPGMEGMFQQISTGLMADAGISIGRRNGQVALQDRRSQFPVMVEDMIAQIETQIWAGNDEQARSMAEQLDWIENQPAHILSAEDKARYKTEILFRSGRTRMLRDLDVENLTPAQIQDLQVKLAKGEDEEVAKFFTEPDGTVRRDLMGKAVYDLNHFLGLANKRMEARKDAFEFDARLNLVLRGGATGTKKEAAALDAYFSQKFGLESKPGHRRQIDMEDWLALDPQTRADAVAVIKDAGFMPTSLEQLLRSLSNVRDPERLTAAFELIRDLDEAGNTAGQSVSMLDHVPEPLREIYTAVSGLHGDGSINQESVAEAVAQWNAQKDMEWNDETLARRMNADNRWLDGRRKVAAENARGEMRRAVVTTIFDGIEATPEEKDNAVARFETYYRSGHTFDEAVEMAGQGVKDAYMETKYMAGAVRSAYAPEKHYADLPVATVGGFFDRVGRDIASGALDTLEDAFIEIPSLLFFMPQPDGTLGSLEVNASLFDRIADAKIRELIAEDAYLSEEIEGIPFLKGGADYKLAPQKGGGMPPLYHVYLVGDRGTRIPVGVLDVREEFEVAQRAEVAAKSLENLGQNSPRFQEFLYSGDPKANAVWEQIFSDAIEGRTTDYDAILEGLPGFKPTSGPALR